MAVNYNELLFAVPSATIQPAAPLTAANTNMDGSGVLGEIYTCGANGSWLDEIKIIPLGTNVTTVVRFFLDNGARTVGNIQLLGEVTMPTQALSQTAAFNPGYYIDPRRIKAGFRLSYCLGTAVAVGFSIVPKINDY